MIDRVTKRWIRNESDERAAAAGYRFDESRGLFVVNWLQDYLILYEGECAGEPFVCHDWQYDDTMRLFGWVRYSERWKRFVRRFHKAFIMVAKKNKKSPTLAGWGLYLLCGDGEMGQKVFLAAKDGTQARGIAGRHAVEMVLASERLRDECTINRNLMSITHEPTRSVMLPLSSGDSRTQESKEGLNGSVLIDEVHVVDRPFVARISRAGISRSEPLMIEVTTAGNNPDSYGKERYEYAKKVLAGEEENHRLFVALYEAPQDLSDQDLDADPLKYGQMANPAWGHTIDPEEYLADYQTSKQSIRALADFKMYRLNIWQRSSSPWLRAEHWTACAQEFTEQDLYGQVCGAGLDLSITEDLTAFSLVFPEDIDAWFAELAKRRPKQEDAENEEAEDGDDQPRQDIPIRFLTWYWLPEETLARHSQDVDYAQWEHDGWLRKTPGAVMEYAIVEDDIAEILTHFDVRMVAYDERFAVRTMQILQAKCGLKDDQVYAFPQSVKGFTGPSAMFERLVISGKAHHNNNPCTTWQAGHVHVDRRRNEGLMPIKPAEGSILKIDGIVGTIMGLDAAQRMPPPKKSVYKKRGAIFL